MSTAADELLTVDDAQRRWRLSASDLRRLKRRGLKTYRFTDSGTELLLASELIAAIASRQEDEQE